jgi:hypothetical protein
MEAEGSGFPVNPVVLMYGRIILTIMLKIGQSTQLLATSPPSGTPGMLFVYAVQTCTAPTGIPAKQ